MNEIMDYSDGTVLSSIVAAGCRVYGETGAEIILFCDYHHNTRTPSAEINKETGVFYCFACQRHATLIELICHVSKMSYFEALRLVDKYQKDMPILDIINNKIKHEVCVEPYDQVVINKLASAALNSTRAKEYFTQRGISEQSIKDYFLGYSEKMDMVTFPYFSSDGSFIIGFQGRSIEGKTFKNSLGSKKSETLFGIHLYKWSKYVFCVESPIDSILLHQHGISSISTMGANPSQKQIDLIKKYFNQVYVVADNDIPGKSSALKTCKKLGSRATMILPPEGYKDIGEMPYKDIPKWAEQVKNPIGIFNER